MSLNINGLRSHLDEAQLLSRSLGIHILALSETKLDPHYPKELTSLPGYQQERLDRTSSGGGVSIYIRDSIKYKLHSDVPRTVERGGSQGSYQGTQGLRRPVRNKVCMFSLLQFTSGGVFRLGAH